VRWNIEWKTQAETGSELDICIGSGIDKKLDFTMIEKQGQDLRIYEFGNQARSWAGNSQKLQVEGGYKY